MSSSSAVVLRAAPKAFAYPALVGLPAMGLLLVLHYGASLAPASAIVTNATSVPPGPAPDVVLRLGTFIAQIVVILAVSRVVARLLARIGQPAVVGEMLAGVLLGPILIAAWPSGYALLFPAGSVRFLGAVSELGVVLFMFHVGVTLRPDELRGRGHVAVLTSHTSIIVPLFLGAATSLLLFPRVAPPGVAFVPFALFVGAAMAVTAFPVLARLLDDRGLTHTPLGTLALACAAVDDVSAWCILAIVAAIADHSRSFRDAAIAIVGTVAFAIVMLKVVQPRLAWLAQDGDDAPLSRDRFAFIIVVALSSAWVTHQLGTHALFGAFLGGVVMPKSDRFVRKLTQPIQEALFVIMLPLFFAVTGIRMSFGVISGAAMWQLFALVLLVAVAGKLAGSAIAARVSGLSWRESLALGSLMNTRGLMALVILNAGLELGVLSQPLFVIMVLMSIITTLMTTPMMAALQPKHA